MRASTGPGLSLCVSRRLWSFRISLGCAASWHESALDERLLETDSIEPRAQEHIDLGVALKEVIEEAA